MLRFHPKNGVLKPAAAAVGCLLLGWMVPGVHAQNFGQTPPPRGGNLHSRSNSVSSVPDIGGKLSGIVLPDLEFRQTTLSDAVEYLRQESRRLDHDPNPNTRGVNIVLQLPAVNGAGGLPAAAGTRITLKMNQLPLLEALKFVASQAGLKVKIEPYAVSLVPQVEPIETMKTAVLRVPPGFFGTTDRTGAHPID